MDGDTSGPVSAFFLRNGLAPAFARAKCQGFARARYSEVQEVSSQGYCSYTLLVDGTTIVQFRPVSHRIDTKLAELACDVYGNLAPETRFLGTVSVVPAGPKTALEGELHAYSMVRIPGVSLAELRSAGRALRPDQREGLVKDFAHFLSVGWKKSSRKDNSPEIRNRVKAKVGGSIRWRLEKMRDELPPRFRSVVVDTLAHLHEIEALPWVLTHGDVVPGNVMVEASSGALRGLLDWAEAEFLPFGVGISSIEELLGEASRAWDSVGPYPPPGSRFEYYPEAGDLRRLLWNVLEEEIPDLAEGTATREAVERARVMGILLWHGIAFDDGKLDRVVREGRDDEEIQRLDMFLLGTTESRVASGNGVAGKGPFPQGTRLTNPVLGRL